MPSTEPRTVLHVVAAFTEREGGPARYISELCGDLIARGHAISLLTSAAPDDALMPLDARIELHVVSQVGRQRNSVAPGGFSGTVAAWTRRHPGGIVHLHGLWRNGMHQSALVARRARRPVVWAPMGMLEPWARKHHAWKKRIAWWLYQRRDLARAAVVHATSRLEADGLRKTGLRGPIAVVPLGVALPPPVRAPRATSPTRTALFLSRIHPKKGLLMLLEAWAALRPPGWQLIIAGNDEGGHAAEVRAAIDRLRLVDVVSLAGPLYGEKKEAAFRAAQLFVLPSHSENFAVVVAEALVRGLPVLTTTGTPWSELVIHGAGWCVNPAVAPIQRALAEATGRSPGQLARMGRAGETWARRKFSWNDIVTQIEELYAWLSPGRSRERTLPPFVRLK